MRPHVVHSAQGSTVRPRLVWHLVALTVCRCAFRLAQGAFSSLSDDPRSLCLGTDVPGRGLPVRNCLGGRFGARSNNILTEALKDDGVSGGTDDTAVMGTSRPPLVFSDTRLLLCLSTPRSFFYAPIPRCSRSSIAHIEEHANLEYEREAEDGLEVAASSLGERQCLAS